jgi:histidyl-tRNA synthetase
MHDILPEHTPVWQYLEEQLRNILRSYGYREFRLPILEKTELFKRSIGEVTDIVEKEMYTFDDRNGDSLTLRPEGTAGGVRAGIENGLLYNQLQRLWYIGPMFRHERPQKGRYRQFHQIGVETFGFQGADIEAELIAMCARMWDSLGLSDINLEINTLGTVEERQDYRAHLVEYLNAHKELLDEDSLRRLEHNPLRILDSKNPAMQDMIESAPRLLQHLSDSSTEHFEHLKELLDLMGIQYRVNTRLVRGLDYYSHTVFEWVTENLGAQGTVCAGGRYDGLVEQLGGKPTFAAGFALGMERLIALIEESQQGVPDYRPHFYLVMVGNEAEKQGIILAEKIRSADTRIRLVMNCSGGSFKSQLKRADKSGADYALIIGENELKESRISIKPLRAQGEQVAIANDEIIHKLIHILDQELMTL